MRRFLIAVLAAIFLTIFTFHYSSGFALSKILFDLPIQEEVESFLPKFSEPYTYLSHGRQSFVFQSADGKSVIKFFNQNYFNPHWYHFLPAPQKWKRRQKEKIALRQTFYQNSYLLAMQELPEETGVCYVHLHKSSLLPLITLIDPSGRSMQVDLNQTAFIIQKKAKPYLGHLEEVWEKQGSEGLKKEIDAWIDFCAKRIFRKISDYDHDIWQNAGVLDGKLLFIDPGKFYRNERVFEKDFFELEWWKATHRLHHWLLIHDPAAASYLLDQVQKQQSKNID